MTYSRAAGRAGTAFAEVWLTIWRAGTMLTAVAGTADHVRRNRAAWDRWAAVYAEAGSRNCAMAEPKWSIWAIAEAQAGVLPGDLEGRHSIELGCGTGNVSAWPATRHPLATLDWARQWPWQEIWTPRKLR